MSTPSGLSSFSLSSFSLDPPFTPEVYICLLWDWSISQEDSYEEQNVDALSLLCFIAPVTSAPAPAAEWKPTKPITAIVPWPAGGATDLTVRILASEMEKVLGQRISVVNTPGASGAIGMQNAYDAAKDGYTWAGNADVSIVNYPVLDLMKITHRDWNHWYALMTPNIIATTADYPVKDVADLVKMMKEKPGQVAVASAGVGSSGHLALEVFKSATGTTPRHVPYAGGNPAVIATISGESNVVMQLSMEEADMIRAKKLKPLANTSNRTLNISGYGEVPPITKWFPNFPSTGSHFGIMVAKGVPPEVGGGDQQGLRRCGEVGGPEEVRRREGGLPGEPQGGGGHDRCWKRSPRSSPGPFSTTGRPRSRRPSSTSRDRSDSLA